MTSRSFSNLLDLTSDFPPPLPQAARRALPSVMTVPGILPDEAEDSPTSEDADAEAGGAASSSSSSSSTASAAGAGARCIVAANILPLLADRNPDGTGWSFSWDSSSILLHLKHGLGPDTDILYVGFLSADIDPSDHDTISSYLLQSFNCVPAFLPADVRHRFYHGFCKQQLWPLFHYMLPLINPDVHGGGPLYDRLSWQAYVSVNKAFSDKIMEVISPDEDYVWIHDYHLMLLPTFLRKRFSRVKLGFFLHSPFPSSEIYRTLPVRDEMLRALLNADVIGFHTFDYARHFLSCCRRILGLEYESKRGYISIDYYGRSVNVKIMPVGIHMEQLRDCLSLPETQRRIEDLRRKFDGKAVLLGVDDMDIFKGIGLKLAAMEQLLGEHPEWVGKVVMVQIANPARSHGKEVSEVQTEAIAAVERINGRYGGGGYRPVVLIRERVKMCERIAYYTVADCCVVTAVRDGMNLIPYEYTACRSAGVLVVSEFVGCSPSLSGAIRVNPWNTDSLADALNEALAMPEAEKRLRHEKHYRYVSSHEVGYWAQSFMSDLRRTCERHATRRSWGVGFGLSFRIMALDPDFRKLSPEHIASAYCRTSSRAIILDYDGTMTPQSSVDNTPSLHVLRTLNVLCSDPRNRVFIVSSRGQSILADWFSSCNDRLAIAAEHGFFCRWRGDGGWETSIPLDVDMVGWKGVAEPVMDVYTETTDGSFIEKKQSSLVWHYRDADPDFGAWQAKELLDHLESVLANEPVSVKMGKQTVEVMPQGVSKGAVAEKLLSSMASDGAAPDFVLCCGDDRSDEDMFERIMGAAATRSAAAAASGGIQAMELFLCTVGRKPSKAKYYLDDTAEVIKVLEALAQATPQPGSISAT